MTAQSKPCFYYYEAHVNTLVWVGSFAVSLILGEGMKRKKTHRTKLSIVTAAALLLGSITAYANGTSIIMYGKYVTGIDNSEKTGPGASTGSGSSASSGENQAAAISSSPEAASENTATESNTANIANAVSGMSNASGSANILNAAEIDTSEATRLAELGVPADATVLVTLKGDANSDTGTLTLLTKQQSADGKSYWTKLNECTAKYGKAGLGKTKEGDNKTPVGVFKMNTPFGIKDAEAGFPSNYIKVDKDCYWNGDSQSELYNKLVSTRTYTAFRTSESEHLINYAPYYNYCIDTGYNADGTPYKGSAIFLHCVVGNENTHGCIAIPEENMKEVLRTYAEGTTYIVIEQN